MEIRLSYNDPTADCYCLLDSICTCNEKQLKQAARQGISQVQNEYNTQGKTYGTINPTK